MILNIFSYRDITVQHPKAFYTIFSYDISRLQPFRVRDAN